MANPGRLGPDDLTEAVIGQRQRAHDALNVAHRNMFINRIMVQDDLVGEDFGEVIRNTENTLRMRISEYENAHVGLIPRPELPNGDIDGFLQRYPRNRRGRNLLLRDLTTDGSDINMAYGEFNAERLRTSLHNRRAHPQQRGGGGGDGARRRRPPPGHNIAPARRQPQGGGGGGGGGARRQPPPPPGARNRTVRGNRQANPQDAMYRPPVLRRPGLDLGGLPP